MLLNSNITIEAGERRRTDVTDHTVACFLYSPTGYGEEDGSKGYKGEGLPVG